jgi:hypothetical protein
MLHQHFDRLGGGRGFVLNTLIFSVRLVVNVIGLSTTICLISSNQAVVTSQEMGRAGGFGAGEVEGIQGFETEVRGLCAFLRQGFLVEHGHLRLRSAR